MKTLKDKISNLPQKPGIYFFKNSNEKIIYIGKSINLRKRVKSYFQYKNHGYLTNKMVSEIRDIDFRICRSEFEALLTEAALVNQHQPYYNVRLKDDKRFLMIAVSDEEYPRIFTARKKEERGVRYFGPFPSSGEVKRVLKTIRQIFPYCSCSSKIWNKKRACLYYHINLCPGCCIGYPKSEYQKIIRKIIKFLNGDIKGVIKQLTKEMKQASEKLDFEKASQIKKQIEAINYVVLNWQTLDEESLSIILPEDRNKNILKQAKKVLPSLTSLERIECYDISNLYGRQATGSMVVFENFLPNKKQYRRFKIIFSSKSDDLEMMREVVERRLRHQEWQYPGLMIVDGGKGQVSAVFDILRSKGLTDKIFLLGLAKKEEIIFKPEVKDENIIGWREMKLKKNSDFLRILQRLRDESHRFAKKYHLLLRKKKFKMNP